MNLTPSSAAARFTYESHKNHDGENIIAMFCVARITDNCIDSERKYMKVNDHGVSKLGWELGFNQDMLAMETNYRYVTQIITSN